MNTKSTLKMTQSAWFGLAQLGLILVFAIPAFKSSFRGGGFVTALLAIILVAQMLCIIRDLRPKPTSSSEEGTQAEPSRYYILAAVEVIASLLALVVMMYFLGMYVAPLIFCILYWHFALGLSLKRTLVLSLIFGLAAPLLFSKLLSITLWTGIVPEIIPDFLGGSITPPF